MVSMGSFNSKKHSRQIQLAMRGMGAVLLIAKFSYERNRCKPLELSNSILRGIGLMAMHFA